MGRTECACELGWDGARCDVCAMGYHPDGAGGCTTDVCLPNPCTEPLQTVCVAAGATATCECDAGAHPDGAGGCTTDPCLPDLCLAMNMACRVVGDAPECFVPECDDMNPCTDDEVVGGTCVYTDRGDGAVCSTDICLVGETCLGEVCGGGSALDCDDGDPCTADSCGAAGCFSTPDDTLVPPDDGVACTVGSCRGGMAVHTPSNAFCDDGLYCDGAEVCMPGPGADVDGCVAGTPPAPPGPSTPCDFYSCNEAMKAFVRSTLATGASCNDSIACTSGDVCDASGTCAGAVTASCAPSASCTSTSSFQSDIDIGLAPVTGTITQNGLALPMTTPEYQNGMIWARAQDTGKLHRLRLIDWARGSYPNYTRSAGTDTIQTMLVPGTYDILYQRAYQTSSDYVYAQERTPYADPVVNGYRVMQTGVVVSGASQVINVDIRSVTLAGTITMGGDELPSVTPEYQNGIVWLRARDTGKLHRLQLIDWARGSYPNYTRTAGTDRYTTTMIPGTYDVLYQRAYQSSSDYVYAQELTPYEDTVVNGYRVLQLCVLVE